IIIYYFQNWHFSYSFLWQEQPFLSLGETYSLAILRKNNFVFTVVLLILLLFLHIPYYINKNLNFHKQYWTSGFSIFILKKENLLSDGSLAFPSLLSFKLSFAHNPWRKSGFPPSVLSICFQETSLLSLIEILMIFNFGLDLGFSEIFLLFVECLGALFGSDWDRRC
ncbi:hypothetical protein ACJX0J_020477, partial [Zea mays]